MFENSTVKLVDLCTEVSYGYTASANEEKVGPKFLRITDIQGGEVEWDDVPYCETDEKNLEKNKLLNGDIVVARTGNSTGENYLFDSDEEAVFASYLIKFRIDHKLANPYFVWLQMRTNNWWNYVAGSKSGSAQAGANAKVLGQFEFFLPERTIQDKAAEVILDFNQNLALNRQTNQTLEHIAQAIFKSWFVDFEPTRAKIAAKQEGLDPERAAMAAISGKSLAKLDQLSPEQQEQLKCTAALFPDALVDSELGEIPASWEIKLNGEVMDVRDGTHDSPKRSERGFPLVTSKHITSGVLKIEDTYLICEEDYQKINKRSKVNHGDILLTMIGTVGIPYLVSQPKVNFAIKNVGLFRTSAVNELKNYFYLLLQSPEMKAYLEARMAGTTQKYLSLKTLRSLEMLVPPGEVLNTFNSLINPIMEKIFASIVESNELSKLRDSLLPQLLNGELILKSDVGVS